MTCLYLNRAGGQQSQSWKSPVLTSTPKGFLADRYPGSPLTHFIRVVRTAERHTHSLETELGLGEQKSSLVIAFVLYITSESGMPVNFISLQMTDTIELGQWVTKDLRGLEALWARDVSKLKKALLFGNLAVDPWLHNRRPKTTAYEAYGDFFLI